MLKSIKNYFIYFVLIIALASCVSRVNKHGYMFDLADHDRLKAEITSKDVVLRIMGSPTIITSFDNDETWIYFAEDVRSLLFFRPDVVRREVMAIKFDNDTIKELSHLDLSNEEKLKFASDYTKVESSHPGFFKSIFGNIGQVRSQ